MRSELSRVPQFGLYHLTLVDAGMLIAKCLWFQGKLSSTLKDRDGMGFFDEDLEAALQSQADHFAKRLLRAVQTGSLATASTARDIDDHVRPARPL